MKKQKRISGEQRNFVAKYAKRTGAGRHNDQKNDVRRQPKHRYRQSED